MGPGRSSGWVLEPSHKPTRTGGSVVAVRAAAQAGGTLNERFEELRERMRLWVPGFTERGLRRRRRRAYPVWGALLALGAPVGLLVLRAFLTSEAVSWVWVVQEVGADAPTYLYTLLSTAVVFSLLGRRLGLQQDHLLNRSTHDSLTGLANRRLFEPRLREEIARSTRNGSPLSLLVLDLDHLKIINDEWGHDAGDEALRDIGRVLTSTCRASDIAARLGGDEFALLAPDTASSEAATLADRIQGAMGDIRVRGKPISVSIGLADTDAIEERTSEALFEVADQALYKAKKAGRARTSMAPPSVRPGE